MSMSDPVADMLTRIRNAQRAKKPAVSMPSSKFKVAIAQILKNEGYVRDFVVEGDSAKKVLQVTLKYFEGAPVIERIDRVSRPGLRVYKHCTDIPRVMDGLGVTIVSTPQGVMSDRQARKARIGG